MAEPLVDCPDCGGRGRPHPNDPEPCPLCGGEGGIPADFAAKTAPPRREGVQASCEDCFEIRWCVHVERPARTVPLCARCYTREVHPHLLAPAEAPEEELCRTS